MGITPLTFTGISKFSDDFQTILTRAVSIASLPVKQLQNEQADLLQQKQLTANLSGAAGSLAASLQALGEVGASSALSASSSNSSKVAVSSFSAIAPASYEISNIQSIAKAASETSLSGYASSTSSAVSADGNLRLTVGSTEYAIHLTAAQNNLAGLRDVINGLNAGVTATILTTGSGSTPNYLLIGANQTGKNTLRLTDVPDAAPEAELLTSSNQGANAEFELNHVPVSQPNNLVSSVIPGLSFAILGTTSPGENITVNLASDRGRLSAALEDLAAKYNAVQTQINAQVGPHAGLLSGDSLIRQVQQALHKILGYQGSGAIRTIADLGIEVSTTGEMSLNEQIFDNLPGDRVAAAFQFLGSAATGFGSVSRQFTAISDPQMGVAAMQQNQYDQTDRRLSEQIDAITARINVMEASMTSKLQMADTLLAKLESQQNTLTASIDSLSYTTYGKKGQ